jgi:Domain of unknown function (DUF4375)
MYVFRNLLICLIVVANSACSKREASPPGISDLVSPKLERKHIVVDEKTIAGNDAQAAILPAWYAANIYGSYADYESSLAKFSRNQRLVVAMEWYAAEVNNGGHDQFYSNSTGIVWEDAQKGFEEIGMPDVARIIEESAKRMGGRPSFDRAERNRVMQQLKPKFDDLDNQFYGLNGGYDAKVLNYVRAHAKDFLFDGEVELP